jgi:hypothetical protein
MLGVCLSFLSGNEKESTVARLGFPVAGRVDGNCDKEDPPSPEDAKVSPDV